MVWRGVGGQNGGNKLLFLLTAMVRLNLEFVSERTVKGWREGGKNRGRTTDGDGWRSGSLSASVRGEQMLYWSGCTTAQSAGSGGGGGEGNGGEGRGEEKRPQPCLPRGPPCLRRQDPSSVSKAIFTNAWKLLLLSLRLSCEGMKHRQIPSLGTQQQSPASKHLMSTLCP